VVNELRGEKIDVIRWSPDPSMYIANSLSPARVDMVRLVDPEGQHAHVLVPPDQLSLAIGREGQNVRLAARLTGWKLDIKNSNEYDQASEDEKVAELIALRQEDEALQAEAEARLAVEQAARAEEDARLRELYPLPEDDEEYGSDSYTYQGSAEQAGADAATEPDDSESENGGDHIDSESAEESPSAEVEGDGDAEGEAELDAEDDSEDGAPGQEGTR
jgi:N utilization substance protein A